VPLKTTITPPPPPPPIDPGPMVVPIGDGGHPTLTPGGSLGEALGGYEGSIFPPPPQPPPPPSTPQPAPIQPAKLPKPTPKHMAWPAKLALSLGIPGLLAGGGFAAYKALCHNGVCTLPTSAPQASTDQTTPDPSSAPPPANLPAGFPANLSDGAYDLQVCISGQPSCIDAGTQTLSNGDISSFAQAISSAVDQINSSCVGNCSARYSGFDGQSFTVTITATDCTSGSCYTATSKIVVTKVG
jgi:hypothetical protein